MGALGLIWFFTAFRAGFWSWVFRTGLIGTVAGGVWVSTGIVGRKVVKELEKVCLGSFFFDPFLCWRPTDGVRLYWKLGSTRFA